MHSLLLANIKNSGNGDFRNIEVFVKGANFQPTPAIFIEEEMNELVNFFLKNKDWNQADSVSNICKKITNKKNYFYLTFS